MGRWREGGWCGHQSQTRGWCGGREVSQAGRPVSAEDESGSRRPFTVSGHLARECPKPCTCSIQAQRRPENSGAGQRLPSRPLTPSSVRGSVL